MKTPPEFDAIFHQPVRTRLCLLLHVKAHSFSEIKTKLKITDGNLDAHLKKLSAAGYLHSEMVIKNRPQTIYELSETGSKAFGKYLAALQKSLDFTAKC